MIVHSTVEVQLYTQPCRGTGATLRHLSGPKTLCLAGCAMGFIGDTVDTLRRMDYRELAQQIINLGMILSSALIIWKTLILFTCSESPVVVVLRCARHKNCHHSSSSCQIFRVMCSGSMEPAFQRGDILFLNNWVDAIIVTSVSADPACAAPPPHPLPHHLFPARLVSCVHRTRRTKLAILWFLSLMGATFPLCTGY